jgi:hypothetical protein
MTLPTQNNVRRTKTPDTLERNVVEGLNEDLQSGNESTENSPNLARACSLAIDGVVYKID